MMAAMRLQRMLARSGVASRREAEELIRKGRVRVNGAVARIGMSVEPTTDVVEVNGNRVTPAASAWIAVNKPVGYVVTKRDERKRPTVFDLVPSITGLTYVGRLDINTSGLLLMTNDGGAVNKLTHPRHEVQRTYLVEVSGLSVSAIRRALSKPIVIDGRPVKIISSKVRQSGKPTMRQIHLTLAEGRNRIVRRTCAAIGLSVGQLVRLSHGPIELGDLGSGEWRYLSSVERAELRRVCSI